MSPASAEKWDERYASGEARIQPPHPLVMRAAELLPVGRALDVACGLGHHALALAARGWHVTALDHSAIALQKIATHPLNSLIETVQADLTASEFTPAPASYDLIVMTNYLQRDLFVTLRQALRPGGLFVAVIALVDEDQQVKPMNPAFLLQAGELAEFFTDEEMLNYREGKPDGDWPGRAMAEIIARRKP